MKYTIVVGDLKDAMQVDLGSTPGNPEKQLVIYNQQGERLIWKASFRLTVHDLRKLGRGLRATADFMEEEEREKQNADSHPIA